MWRTRRFCTILLFVTLALWVVVSCLGSGPSPTAPASLPAPTAAGTLAAARPIRYGVVYPYPNSWTEADRPAIREQLAYLRGLGVDVVVQVFSSQLVDTGQEKDWLIFLDEAQAQGIQVIARLWPPNDWDGSHFDFYYVSRFLAVIQDHPALLAYFALHEPLEQFNGDQLRAYYQAVKSYAPRVLVFNAMSDIAGFEADPRFFDRRFTAGICDICAIWYYPFVVRQGKPAFDRQRVLDVMTANDALVRARDPNAQLWFLGQAYALSQSSPPLRMPSAQEMDDLAALLLEDPRIDGLLWYPWSHGSYDQVLGDPASAEQQAAVGTIYEKYLARLK
jgi:hypothetical protein